MLCCVVLCCVNPTVSRKKSHGFQGLQVSWPTVEVCFSVALIFFFTDRVTTIKNFEKDLQEIPEVAVHPKSIQFQRMSYPNRNYSQSNADPNPYGFGRDSSYLRYLQRNNLPLPQQSPTDDPRPSHSQEHVSSYVRRGASGKHGILVTYRI